MRKIRFTGTTRRRLWHVMSVVAWVGVLALGLIVALAIANMA
ncbi:MAG TPA: hypothetical protein VHP37_33325 [Burkholderiales bacterium]|nr:hypothetical protein [Burkholderiales bacterium]